MKPSYNIPFSSLNIEHEVGSGGFGIVYKAELNLQAVAVKLLPKMLYTKPALQSFRNEVQVMQQIVHERIVICRGYVDEPENLRFGIVLEFMECGSLSAWIDIPEITFTEMQVLTICEDTALGMAYLHSCNIIHHDLKSENIFLDRNKRAKVGDFGLSIIRHEASMSKVETTAGTIAYLPPECFGQNPFYGSKSDVYSYGVILWEIVAWDRLYKGLESSNTMFCILHNQKPDIPVDNYGLGDIIRSCWSVEYDNRPSFIQLVGEFKKFEISSPSTLRTSSIASNPALWPSMSGSSNSKGQLMNSVPKWRTSNLRGPSILSEGSHNRDATIAVLMQESVPGKSKDGSLVDRKCSKLVLILLVSFFVFMILAGLGVGMYFLLRPKEDKYWFSNPTLVRLYSKGNLYLMRSANSVRLGDLG
jgi:serine/threonine protein kinase